MSKEVCSVEGCQRIVRAKGLCDRHYGQYLKHGKVLERTFLSPNDFIFYKDYIGIVLRNREQEEVAETIIDYVDYDCIKEYKWSLNTDGYAKTAIKGSTRSLQKILFPNMLMIDHKNKNKLDNRRQNLRECTFIKNGQNRKIGVNNTSECVGVYRCNEKWRAYIKYNKKPIHLGIFFEYNQAVKARKEAEKKYFGDFAPSRETT